jgi:twitching motility protein PilU
VYLLSDLFVSKDFPPTMKMHGTMKALSAQKLSAEVSRKARLAVISQRLVRSIDGKLKAAIEIPLNTLTVAELQAKGQSAGRSGAV